MRILTDLKVALMLRADDNGVVFHDAFLLFKHLGGKVV
jgi:hypothetical protein